MSEVFVEVEGVRLRAVVDGPNGAPAVLVLHGFTGGAPSMEVVAAALASDYRVARLELVGHGESEAPEDVAVRERVENAAGEELRQFIERVEHLEAEKKEIAEGIREVLSEAKGRGYSTTILRKVIALRKRDADDIAEEEAVLDMYKAALGMS